MFIVIFEWIGVVTSWGCKWLRASDARKMRKVGFIAATFVNLYWIVFFLYTKQYGLVCNGVVNFIILNRGIKNNSKKKRSK